MNQLLVLALTCLSFLPLSATERTPSSYPTLIQPSTPEYESKRMAYLVEQGTELPGYISPTMSAACPTTPSRGPRSHSHLYSKLREVVKREDWPLLHHVITKRGVNFQSSNGRTLLHHAANLGKYQIAHYLLFSC